MKLRYLISCAVCAIVFTSCELDAVKDSGTNELEVSDTTEQVAEGDTSQLLVDSLDTTGLRPRKLVLDDGMTIIWDIHGTGGPVNLEAPVFMNYVGRNSNGEEIENTARIKTPIPYVHGYGMSMKAWDKFLEHAHVGDKVRMTIPASLAYGEKGQPKVVRKGQPSEYLVKPGEEVKYQAQIVAQPEPNHSSADGVRVWLIRSRKEPKALSGKVAFDYVAYQEGGKKFFNSSFQNQEPFVLNLNKPNLMPGLVQGISFLNDGDQALIMIPSELGYGPEGYLDIVAPGADLLYDIKRVAQL